MTKNDENENKVQQAKFFYDCVKSRTHAPIKNCKINLMKKVSVLV